VERTEVLGFINSTKADIVEWSVGTARSDAEPERAGEKIENVGHTAVGRRNIWFGSLEVVWHNARMLQHCLGKQTLCRRDCRSLECQNRKCEARSCFRFFTRQVEH
jgi:hypothetical protein